jgi:hypothetical protein
MCRRRGGAQGVGSESYGEWVGSIGCGGWYVSGVSRVDRDWGCGVMCGDGSGSEVGWLRRCSVRGEREMMRGSW